MNFARCDAIAKTVLYEGYNLYPYRPSALKNRRRWTFGGVFPREWTARAPDDRCQMQVQCLVRGGCDTALAVRARFLHIVARELGELLNPDATLPPGAEPEFRPVPSLEVDGTPMIAWEEAKEREIIADSVALDRLTAVPARVPFAIPEERRIEPITAADGHVAGLTVCTAEALQGEVVIAAERVLAGAYRITVRVDNITPLAAVEALARDTAQRFAFASTHILLGVERGAFASLLDPPPDLGEAAAQCVNLGCWPVLVGEEGATDMVLAAPIILYDYPRIAPESPGDLFDGCEIDEILTLRILTLTDAEKREIAAADPRSRAMLERTEALGAEGLGRLHGTFRDAAHVMPGHDEMGTLRPGDRVRLRPKSGGDIMDVVLKGQIAVVEAVERDFEDRVHVAVTILDDPGRDLGMARMPGHRFFFAPDEVEPVLPGEAT